MEPYVEQNCTIEHEGRKFEAGGAVITDGYVFGYPKGNVLQNWHGDMIGTCRVLSTWNTPRSYISPTMSSYEVFANGVRYVGRGAGDGMLLRAKRSPKQGR